MTTGAAISGLVNYDVGMANANAAGQQAQATLGAASASAAATMHAANLQHQLGMEQINADAKQLAAQIEWERQKIWEQHKADAALANISASASTTNARIQAETARQQIAAELYQSQLQLEEMQRQFQATFGLDVDRFLLDARMQQAQEFAEPFDWVKQASFLRGQSAPQGGPTIATPQLTGPGYQPLQIPQSNPQFGTGFAQSGQGGGGLPGQGQAPVSTPLFSSQGGNPPPNSTIPLFGGGTATLPDSSYVGSLPQYQQRTDGTWQYIGHSQQPDVPQYGHHLQNTLMQGAAGGVEVEGGMPPGMGLPPEMGMSPMSPDMAPAMDQGMAPDDDLIKSVLNALADSVLDGSISLEEARMLIFGEGQGMPPMGASPEMGMDPLAGAGPMGSGLPPGPEMTMPGAAGGAEFGFGFGRWTKDPSKVAIFVPPPDESIQTQLLSSGVTMPRVPNTQPTPTAQPVQTGVQPQTPMQGQAPIQSQPPMQPSIQNQPPMQGQPPMGVPPIPDPNAPPTPQPWWMRRNTLIPGAAGGAEVWPFVMPDGSTTWYVQDPEMGRVTFPDENSARRYAARLGELSVGAPQAPNVGVDPANNTIYVQHPGASEPVMRAPMGPPDNPSTQPFGNPMPATQAPQQPNQQEQSAARAAIVPMPGTGEPPTQVSAVEANAARDIQETQQNQFGGWGRRSLQGAQVPQTPPAPGATGLGTPPQQYNPNGLASRGYGTPTPQNLPPMAPASAQPVYGGPPVPGQPQPVHVAPEVMGMQTATTPTAPVTPMNAWEAWVAKMNDSQRKMWEYGHGRSDDLTGVNPMELGAWTMPTQQEQQRDMQAKSMGTPPSFPQSTPQGNLPQAAGDGPILVGENGPEILDPAPGTRVIPINNRPGGPVPLYNVQPANTPAASLLQQSQRVPQRYAVVGAAGGIETGLQTNSFGAGTAGYGTAGAPSDMGATSYGNNYAPARSDVYNSWQTPQNTRNFANAPDRAKEIWSLTGQWPGQPQRPVVPQIMAMGSDPNQPASTQKPQEPTGVPQPTPASPQSQGSTFGYSAEVLKEMPWLQALANGVRLPYYQNYSGPLNLGSLPGGDAFKGIPSLPAPHQISLQTWNRMDPSTEQQMALGAYRALGFDPNTVQRSMMMGAPSTASLAPPRWQRG